MAKNFGKVLLFTAAVGSAVGAICYYLKKKDATQDVEEDDYDDFDDSKDNSCAKSSKYGPLNPEPKADDTEHCDSADAKEDTSDSADVKEDASDSFTPLAEHVAQAAEKAEETVEEFFDEEDSSDEEPPINDN